MPLIEELPCWMVDTRPQFKPKLIYHLQAIPQFCLRLRHGLKLWNNGLDVWMGHYSIFEEGNRLMAI